ncbi:sigma-70 family RNA polymerase sigma factor [Paracrocinitomix mangrovi]|uniref:RNA polymerase sigma factor n=1 Tax=Paracrocinitomix mangrovi TaxID=2862509 RepID=UPI001C8DBBF9|nr:sigma-70 family RNA polymerase sigma factor [Paracrocinitomix mangrovi]UKN01286.1 sigma-70 family RNA polymerase sigma factor [Paracrocinitomix mangrovi]
MDNNFENIEFLDDRFLVQKCIEDDRRYQEALYRKFAKKMFQVCKRYARDNDEAMDFLQEGFIEVFKKLENYRFEGSLEGWVRKVIVFRTIDVLRKEKRYQEIIGELDAELHVEAEEFELLSGQTTAERLRELVNQLPGKAGLVLKLFVIEGLTHPEIAEHLEISIGTSKSQLNRARTLIKASLKSE